MYVTLIPWWRERRRYVPMPQSWTIAGCQGHVLGSSAENLRSGCTCRLFIPVCTGSGSGIQNPLANIHWHFLLKSEMIGAPTWTPKFHHDISSLFPPSENEGYICNRDVVFMENPTSMLWTIVIMISNVSGQQWAIFQSKLNSDWEFRLKCANYFFPCTGTFLDFASMLGVIYLIFFSQRKHPK